MKPKLNPVYFILGLFLLKVGFLDNIRHGSGHHAHVTGINKNRTIR